MYKKTESEQTGFVGGTIWKTTQQKYGKEKNKIILIFRDNVSQCVVKRIFSMGLYDLFKVKLPLEPIRMNWKIHSFPCIIKTISSNYQAL